MDSTYIFKQMLYLNVINEEVGPEPGFHQVFAPLA